MQELKRGEYEEGARADRVTGRTEFEHLHEQTSSFRFAVSFHVLEQPFFYSSPSILPILSACSRAEVHLYSFVFTPLPLKPVGFRLELRRKLLCIFLRFLICVDIEVQEVLVESADVFPDGFEAPELPDLCWKVIVM